MPTGEVSGVHVASKHVIGKTPVKTPVKTPERILELLVANPELTLAEVAKVIDKSVRAVERASAKLVKEGRLRCVGPEKGGHWECIELRPSFLLLFLRTVLAPIESNEESSPNLSPNCSATSETP